MPKFTASRYIEQRYDYAVEAENATAAKRLIENLSDADWGEPNHTSSDQIYLFNENGDEEDNW
jgi:hypothetical protein